MEYGEKRKDMQYVERDEDCFEQKYNITLH